MTGVVERREIARTADGTTFAVKTISRPGAPPIVVCEGSGIGCDHRQIHHSVLPVCAVEIKTNKSTIFACGKPFPLLQDEEDKDE